MVHLLRVLFLLVLSFAGSAHALIPKTTGYQVQSGPILSTPALACDAWGRQFAASVTFQSTSINSDGRCVVNYANGGGNQQAIFIVDAITAGVCPSNSTAVTGGCQCTSPYTENAAHTACVAPLSELEEFCKQGFDNKFTWNQSGTIGASSPLPSGSCYKPDPPFTGADATRGCKTTLVNAMAVPKEGDPTLRSWSGTGVMTGETCDDAAATDAAPKAADDPCPGGFEGTVNGVTKCVPAEPDKGIEGVKSTSQTNADGSKSTTTETTKCAGSVCITTTNITNTSSSGTITNSTSSRTESLEDKCVKDPKNVVCKKTQGGAGSAASEMTCDINSSAEGCGGEGAAIGELYAKKDKTVGQALKKATDALQASPIGSAVTGFFTVGGGGSCPSSSATIPFINTTLTFNMFCTTFAGQMFVIVRAVLLMLATWMAFRIAIDH